MQDQDVIREFLVESHENLLLLDQGLVELEKRPKDAALLASMFRTIHTIKGTCGFLAFSTLEKITHQAESSSEPVARWSAGTQSILCLPHPGDR